MQHKALEESKKKAEKQVGEWLAAQMLLRCRCKDLEEQIGSRRLSSWRDIKLKKEENDELVAKNSFLEGKCSNLGKHRCTLKHNSYMRSNQMKNGRFLH